MTIPCETAGRPPAGNPMGGFERYLTPWVFLCIAAGIGLGQLLPAAFHAIGRLEVAKVNLPVAIPIWLISCRCCSRWISPPCMPYAAIRKALA